jgi:ATP synthase F1 gamma subunit
MLNIKSISQNIEDLVNMKGVVNAYEEIASMKMRHIRGGVLQNRDLITELAAIYRQITISYKNQILQLQKEKKIKKATNLSLKKHNNKTACILFSADSGLFGNVLRKTYWEFVSYLEKTNAEPVIVGNFGKTLFEGQFPDRNFVYLPMPTVKEYSQLLRNITDTLLEYENIVIFYSQFQSMSSQQITMLDMSGQAATNSISNVTEANVLPAPTSFYIFEPSLEKILEFFEKEIFANILEQTFSESELAHYASRIMTLDNARENIDNMLKAVEREKRFVQHRKMNKKQLESMGGISLWKLK